MKGRRLKVFQAHLGFYDAIVAAPSQKAALEAWGASGSEFAKGFARVATDPIAVKKALSDPGKVLRRPYGSNGEFKLEPDPIPAQKPTSRQRKQAAEKADQELRREDAARTAAERELREAQQAELRDLAELKKREAELAKEKSAARNRAQQRIKRAKARLAGTKGVWK
jgi:hypothetical protein